MTTSSGPTDTTGPVDEVAPRRAQGVVKTYDPETGIGIVVLDADGSEVFLRRGSLTGSIFRMLRQGQRIVFDIVEDGGRRFAVRVGVGSHGA